MAALTSVCVFFLMSLR